MRAPKLVPDGVVARTEEFHGFVSRVFHTGSSYAIIIPPSVWRGLGLEYRDLVEVALRKVDEEFALREYGYVPPLGSHVSKKPRLKCPVCGKPGVLSKSSREVRIVHCKCDGFVKMVRHYVSKSKHPDFYRGLGMGCGADGDGGLGEGQV